MNYKIEKYYKSNALLCFSIFILYLCIVLLAKKRGFMLEKGLKRAIFTSQKNTL